MTMLTLAPALTCVDSDAGLVGLWLHGRPETTRHVYSCYAGRWLAFLASRQAGLRSARLEDLHAFCDALDGPETTRGTAIAAVRSLLAFGHRIGYLPFDIGAPLILPRRERHLAERILTVDQAHALVRAGGSTRNRTLLRILYVLGLRAAEAVDLRWRDCIPREEGRGQLSILGKGAKLRVLLCPAAEWGRLWELRPEDPDPDGHVFGLRDTSQVRRIVRRAARRAGLPRAVSPHWLRHASVSHDLDAGTPIHEVRDRVGHASIRTTEAYSHARPGRVAGACLSRGLDGKEA